MSLMMKYFVLKPKGTDKFAAASRRAMLAYSDWIDGHAENDEERQFAADLRDWALREGSEAHPALGLSDERGQF